MSDRAAEDSVGRVNSDRFGLQARGLVEFARALRAGGARLGAAALLDAVAALTAVGLARRTDIRAALRVTLVRDPNELELFDLLFDSFYPSGVRATVGMDAPDAALKSAPRPAERRFAESLTSPEAARLVVAQSEERDASGTESAAERLTNKDFEQMSCAEIATVKRLIHWLARHRARRRSRRSRAGAAAGRVDLRAMLRHDNLDQPRYRAPAPQPRDVVLLVDISGSMSVYSRMFLHLAHALSRGPGRVETFVFATRLSCITRTLRLAEPDNAIAAAARAVPDWDGGTRLGACLAEFNLRWARRVLGAGARVILLSDGLERDATDLLEREATRLARAAHELIWINPLLRHEEYAPLAAGARVLARHADALRPAHNLVSLADFADLLD